MAYHRLTLEDLRNDLKRSWESTPFWSDAEATIYLNHTLRFWNLLTGYWRRKVLVSADGTAYRTLPGSLTFGMQVVYGPTGRPLQISALADLDYGRPRWEEETISDGGTVPSLPQLWAPVGMQEIAIWPAPPALTPLMIDGVADTPQLVLDEDFVDVDDWVATLLVSFSLYIGCFKRGLAATQAVSLSLQDFVRGAAEQNVRLKRSSFFRKFLGLDQERGFRPMMGVPKPVPGAGEGA